VVAPSLQLAATHLELQRSGLEDMFASVACLPGARGFGQGTLATQERNIAATQCQRSHTGAHEPEKTCAAQPCMPFSYLALFLSGFSS
jgi:hypothetical protein